MSYYSIRRSNEYETLDRLCTMRSKVDSESEGIVCIRRIVWIDGTHSWGAASYG